MIEVILNIIYGSGMIVCSIYLAAIIIGGATAMLRRLL
jgi:hypothetical protein